MLDQIMPFIDSPWIYVLVCAVVAVDAFLPIVPSETLVIGVAAFAPDGRTQPALLVVAAVVGAVAGDRVSYAIGRSLGHRSSGRAGPGGRAGSRAAPRRRVRAAHDRARRALARRGATAIITSRFVPGGRTAVTLVAGSTGYPLRAFWPHTALAALAWAAYGTGLGYLGASLSAHPLTGIAAGVVLALGLGVAIEGVRCSLRRVRDRRAGPDRSGSPSGAGDPDRPVQGVASASVGDRREARTAG
ncbi:hypothetical protein GCM10023085_14840 [Actinomadura viridis]|uniref:Membrane protein DedA with SNARE-associated domain n=1 Tax=Actinomadura viridis TaxID=58110 RepID=A0A931DMD3_9ACTN|nr:VTT domain-containing protein [Actinomadura viridis]MBG6093854.1 membrane protein DedA with SNARE-associated domain [Actinomadura viridis]